MFGHYEPSLLHVLPADLRHCEDQHGAEGQCERVPLEPRPPVAFQAGQRAARHARRGRGQTGQPQQDAGRNLTLHKPATVPREIQTEGDGAQNTGKSDGRPPRERSSSGWHEPVLFNRFARVRLATVHQPRNPAQWEADDEEDDEEDQPVLVEAEKQFFSFWHDEFGDVVRDECEQDQVVWQSQDCGAQSGASPLPQAESPSQQTAHGSVTPVLRIFWTEVAKFRPAKTIGLPATTAELPAACFSRLRLAS